MTVKVEAHTFVVAFSGQLKYSDSVLNGVFRFNRIFYNKIILFVGAFIASRRGHLLCYG